MKKPFVSNLKSPVPGDFFTLFVFSREIRRCLTEKTRNILARKPKTRIFQRSYFPDAPAMEFPKRYDPKSFEKHGTEGDTIRHSPPPERKDGIPVFHIVMPPPNVTGKLHV